ncbi:type II toxin-antitoxin system RelE/ParE family toxin [Occultella aeris]|uniref:DNA-binding protein n=1 Tax=Occultella aeris TaxID=2761496 RepID=A0A7M4DE62_9MICO|nr:type II toxin-antitoxin system RelE/ParE family toxin [Occultella aeris]VZO35176.1 hypothetical protein HALOF300_00402 [Occultella aeris]
MAWNVVLVDEVDQWFLALAQADYDIDTVAAAIDLLEEHGPNLGRPVADRVKGSKRHNMKELRPSGTSIRILFIFDPNRNAVLLVAGDKTGNWSGWYERNIPVAEERYDAWLAGNYDEEVN